MRNIYNILSTFSANTSAINLELQVNTNIDNIWENTKIIKKLKGVTKC
jgi:hypothetical protein